MTPEQLTKGLNISNKIEALKAQLNVCNDEIKEFENTTDTDVINAIASTMERRITITEDIKDSAKKLVEGIMLQLILLRNKIESEISELEKQFSEL